jgi:putative YhbY family RNA-binding protein
MSLDAGTRRALRARAHALQPVVLIGNEGLTPAVLKEIGVNLDAHELIKVRVTGEDRQEREDILRQVCEALHAAPVQHIGKILVIYRPAAQKPKPRARPRRKPERPLKRSFQNRA